MFWNHHLLTKDVFPFSHHPQRIAHLVIKLVVSRCFNSANNYKLVSYSLNYYFLIECFSASMFQSNFIFPCFYVFLQLCLYVSMDLCLYGSMFYQSLPPCFNATMFLCFYASMFQVDTWLDHILLFWKAQVTYKVQKLLLAIRWSKVKQIGERHSWVMNLPFGFCEENKPLVILRCIF
jgi:hypothetical protein